MILLSRMEREPGIEVAAGMPVDGGAWLAAAIRLVARRYDGMPEDAKGVVPGKLHAVDLARSTPSSAG